MRKGRFFSSFSFSVYTFGKGSACKWGVVIEGRELLRGLGGREYDERDVNEIIPRLILSGEKTTAAALAAIEIEVCFEETNPKKLKNQH